MAGPLNAGGRLCTSQPAQPIATTPKGTCQTLRSPLRHRSCQTRTINRLGEINMK